MTEIILPKKQYTSDYGDVDVYGASKWLAQFNQKEFNNRNVFSLNHLDLNGWDALNKLSIVNRIYVHNDCRYRCPYTGHMFWSLLPFAIITDNYNRYILDLVKRNDHTYKLWTDTEWTKRDLMDNEKKGIRGPSLIQSTILGSGYETTILPIDGSHKIIVVNLELNNNDKIICYSWEWYNK